MSTFAYDAWLEAPYQDEASRMDAFVAWCEARGFSPAWDCAFDAFINEEEPSESDVALATLRDLVTDDWDDSEPDDVAVEVPLGVLRRLVGEA